jgi:hypothetical protein
MTTKNAKSKGYTVPVFASYRGIELDLLIKEGTDIDTDFKAWDLDVNEYIFVQGYLAEEIEYA